jgi:uncharacterized protein
MLKNTFCHIPGISANSEQKLWAAGIHGWDAMAAAQGSLPPRRAQAVKRHLEESRRRLAQADPRYFADLLPANQQWRLFPEFRTSLAYLDIETTGLSAHGDCITTIALYDGRQIRHYVRGQNLDEFADDIRCYNLIVTYNGKCFDVPFIRASLGLRLDQAHIDLRYVLRSLGYSGGLKGCEKKLGLDRGELEGVDGFFAVLLWEDFQNHGNDRALETLLAYNIQDVVNLEVLLVMAYNLKIQQTPFARSHQIALPTPPQVPFRADGKTISRLMRQYAGGFA